MISCPACSQLQRHPALKNAVVVLQQPIEVVIERRQEVIQRIFVHRHVDQLPRRLVLVVRRLCAASVRGRGGRVGAVLLAPAARLVRRAVGRLAAAIGGRRAVPRGAGQRVEHRRHRVAVLGDVRDDEHPGLGRAALHQLPRHARLEAAALVVPPEDTSAGFAEPDGQSAVQRSTWRYLDEKGGTWEVTYRGYGEPLMGFWPYLRHAHRSVDTPPSATGTSHTTFFIWLFLLHQISSCVEVS
jgi:hypothetical protein